MKFERKFLFAALALVFVLTGCASSGGASTAAPALPDLNGPPHPEMLLMHTWTGTLSEDASREVPFPNFGFNYAGFSSVEGLTEMAMEAPEGSCVSLVISEGHNLGDWLGKFGENDSASIAAGLGMDIRMNRQTRFTNLNGTRGGIIDVPIQMVKDILESDRIAWEGEAYYAIAPEVVLLGMYLYYPAN